MSVARLWHWTCDGCGAVEVRQGYGLPRGWIFVKAAIITHRCPACVESIPPPKRGVPQVVADK